MKLNKLSLMKVLISVLFFLLIFNFSYAVTYTAIASGNFTATTTWSGGIVPPTSLLPADNISIPGGINVVLDKNISISSNVIFTVNGKLQQDITPRSFVMTVGTLSGTGVITVDSMAIGGTNYIFNFSGNDTATKFTSLGVTITNSANIYVTNKLYINSDLNLNSGNFGVANNSTIVMAGPAINMGGGNLNLSNTYNVQYMASYMPTGVELTGNGLAKINVIPTNAQIMLGSNVTVKDTFTLPSPTSTLDLGGADLTFIGNGNIASLGTGNFSIYTSGGSLILNANNSFGSTFYLPYGDDFYNLTMNMTDSNAVVSFASGGTIRDFTVDNQLKLQSGKLDVGTSRIVLYHGGSLIGGSTKSYIVTGLQGDFEMELSPQDSVLFPVGTSTNFAPMTVVSHSPTSGTVLVCVNPKVMRNGINGNDLAISQPVVNASWFVGSSLNFSGSYTVYPIWPAAMEVNSFNRTNAYISRQPYGGGGGGWDKVNATAATSVGNFYTMGRNYAAAQWILPDIFAVADENANLSVPAYTNNVNARLFPNPANDILTIGIDKEISNTDIYNIQGQLIKSQKMSKSNSIFVGDLVPGFYNIRLYGQDFVTTGNFIKE